MSQSGTPEQQSSPAGPMTGLDAWLERWWVRIPARLRAISVLLSEVWRDAIYLTGLPGGVGIVLSLAAFLSGGVEGATHWTFNQLPGAQGIVFTESLPLLLLAAVLGGLSANAGLLLALGYALGDFITGPRLTLHGDPGAVLGLALLRVPQLSSYVVFFFLAGQPALLVRYTVSSFRPALQKLAGRPALAVIEAVFGGLVHATLIYVWSLSTPAIIVVFWKWAGLTPPVSATSYLQNFGVWIALAAGAATCVRGLIAYKLFRNPEVVRWAEDQAKAIKKVEEEKSWLLRVQVVTGALLAAGITALLLSGFLPTFQEGLFAFGCVAVIMLLRNVVLPFLVPFWDKWAEQLNKVPVILRLAYGSYIAYQLTQLVLSYYPDGVPLSSINVTLAPVLTSASIGLLVITLLLPRPRGWQKKTETSVQVAH
jgi:hypothetical protein